MVYTAKKFLTNIYGDNNAIRTGRADRNKLMELMGLDRLGSYDSAMSDEGCERTGDFLKRRLVLNTYRDLYMPMYVLEPVDAGKNIPIIAVHGHGINGKEGLVSENTAYNCGYGMELAKRGYTVFIPDLCGFGERLEDISVERQEKSSCDHLNNVCISMGFSLQAVMVYELMRLVDYIEGSGFSGGRTAVVGFSGGGLTAMLLSAVDERIGCCYTSGYFHAVADTLLKNNLCGCNFIPGLWRSFDIGDIGALIAPRTLIVEYNSDDPLNEDPSEQIKITESAYKKMNSHSFFVFEGKGGHRFSGLGYDAIDKWSEKQWRK